MTTSLTLTEGGESRLVNLSLPEYEALRGLAIVDINPTLGAGTYEVSAGRKIGAVSIGELQVLVRPKVADLNRLLFLLGYSGKRPIWRDDRVQLAEADELLPALAETFVRLAARATEQGLLQGYQTVTDTLPVLRGRILAGEQMTRRYGLPVPLAVEYDDFTVDTAENRILLAAALRLLTVPRLSADARRRLQRLRITLADVTTPTRGSALPTWQTSRLNTHYHDALRLSKIVLAAQSFEHRAGDLAVTGFMFDMWQIYEDFVGTALGEALIAHGGRYVTQLPMHLDNAEEVRMQPDLVWLSPDGTPGAVVDAKYKAERPAGFPNADLYQMLAYCTVLAMPEGHLVYAKGNEAVRSHAVRHCGVVIHCHTLDLGLDPAALLRQVDHLADRIARRKPLLNPLE
ncbi:McrC family protein [Rhodococcus sp. BP22]|uniref:McrC family protein n=1 Tax=Rhodococcus sp. BP22 TaxID=2758566 RepID=UPI0016452BB3|nr:restriction endonuclease [Rhodococcus sp. BP22]